jgi:hypothetical protein
MDRNPTISSIIRVEYSVFILSIGHVSFCGIVSEFSAMTHKSRVRFTVLPDFLGAMVLKQSLLSLVGITFELLERKSVGFSL